MSNKVVTISEAVYPLDIVISDLEEIKDKIKDLIFVTILKDGTAHVSHTGANLSDLALACKLMDKNFNDIVELEKEIENV